MARRGTRDETLGEAVGREVASQVVKRAEGDRFFAPWTGTVPVGPGFWFSATPPLGAMFGQAKTYLLLSGSQFRPPRAEDRSVPRLRFQLLDPNHDDPSRSAPVSA